MYIHLLSNASMDSFPNNRLSEFTNVFVNPVKFSEDDWYASLCEIHIPFNFNSISKEDSKIQCITYSDSGRVVLKETDKIEELIPFNCFIRFVDEKYYQVELPLGYLSLTRFNGYLYFFSAKPKKNIHRP